MGSFCDSTENFIIDKSHQQIRLDSSITEDEARMQCMKHTFKGGEHEGKDFFYQQHVNGDTICGFFNDKIQESDTRVNLGRTFGGICTIPEDAEIKLHIESNSNEINLIKKRSLSELRNVSRLHSRISELEETVKGLQEEHNNMSTSIDAPATAKLKCLRRKGLSESAGSIINFKKDGNNGLERGMTLGDCVRIGKTNKWHFVGHRNEKHGESDYINTCWHYDINDSNSTDYKQLEEWIEKDKGNDNVHKTIMLKEGCIL
jgi:hypothetical protein